MAKGRCVGVRIGEGRCVMKRVRYEMSPEVPSNTGAAESGGAVCDSGMNFLHNTSMVHHLWHSPRCINGMIYGGSALRHS